MLTDEQAATNWCERAQRYFNDMQTEMVQKEAALLARQRDRKRLRAALKERRYWHRAFVKRNGEAIATYHRRQTDRKRLRRVLGMAKEYRRVRDIAIAIRDHRKDALDIEKFHRFCLSGVQSALIETCQEKSRWSARWKAAAKRWRTKAKVRRIYLLRCGYIIRNLHQATLSLIAERDELQRQLEEYEKTQVWYDDPHAFCEKCTIGERTAGIEATCDGLRARFKEAVALCDIAVEQRDALQQRLEEAQEVVDTCLDQYPRYITINKANVQAILDNIAAALRGAERE